MLLNGLKVGRIAPIAVVMPFCGLAYAA